VSSSSSFVGKAALAGSLRFQLGRPFPCFSLLRTGISLFARHRIVFAAPPLLARFLFSAVRGSSPSPPAHPASSQFSWMSFRWQRLRSIDLWLKSLLFRRAEKAFSAPYFPSPSFKFCASDRDFYVCENAPEHAASLFLPPFYCSFFRRRRHRLLPPRASLIKEFSSILDPYNQDGGRCALMPSLFPPFTRFPKRKRELMHIRAQILTPLLYRPSLPTFYPLAPCIPRRKVSTILVKDEDFSQSVLTFSIKTLCQFLPVFGGMLLLSSPWPNEGAEVGLSESTAEGNALLAFPEFQSVPPHLAC